NIAAVLVGGLIGLLLRNGLKERFQVILMQGLGIATFFIGVSGALRGLLKVSGGRLESVNGILLILSLVLGGLVGETLRIEDRLDTFGEYLKRRFQKVLTRKSAPSSNVREADAPSDVREADAPSDVREADAPSDVQELPSVGQQDRFVEAFVSATLVICVGAMSIVGSIEDALMGDPSLLFVKSALDCVLALVMASALGVGALFSILPLAIYQGALTLLALVLKPILTEAVIFNISFVGSALVCCIGINLIWPRKIRVGNLLPSLLTAPLLGWLFSLLNW
ncbi:MAG: DUF554 domain-containing protein, partial [Clostridiaceae bacterium]|nr:DUF554 domain-containing protein [Clostridiaceae bacterium]